MQRGVSGSRNYVPATVSAELCCEELVEAVELGGLTEDAREPVRRILETSGKQRRAALVLRSAMAGQLATVPRVRDGAIAVELLHLGTLAHDDVVDDGRMRRGADTVGVGYGSVVSGFVGGILISRAAEIIATGGIAPTRRFAETAMAMCAGQMSEFEDLFDVDRSIARYHCAIEGKTASLFASAGWFGAWLAGAPAEAINVIAQFGRDFGVAFQMCDDILDLTAGEDETGKRQGNDLLQGVYSLPVIYALEADASLGQVLEQGIVEEDLPTILRRIERSGGIGRALRDCELAVGRAKSTLAGDCMSKAASEELEALLVDTLGLMPDYTGA